MTLVLVRYERLDVEEETHDLTLFSDELKFLMWLLSYCDYANENFLKVIISTLPTSKDQGDYIKFEVKVEAD